MAFSKSLVLAAGLGALFGIAAKNWGGAGWVFVILVAAVAVVALAQQTLP